jgi:chromosome partitioning protein
VNALTAADSVLVPLQAHVFAFKSMPQLEETVTIVQQLNPALRIGGIVVTMVDRRTSVNQVIEETIRQQYGDLVFQTSIPSNIKLVESPAAGQPISVYAADSSGAKAYRRLAEEVATRYDNQ